MKTVLIVSYYYPPLGAIGSMRPQKFARYLSEFGWQPIVLTIDPTQTRAADMDLSLSDSSEYGVRVIRTATRDLTRLLSRSTTGVPSLSNESVRISIKTRLRNILQRTAKNWLYVPDAQNGWYPPAVQAGLSLLREQQVDAIFSTSFPVTSHFVAARLKRACGAPWIADFRDLWTENHTENFYESRWRKRLDQTLENRLLSNSDAIVTVSETLAKNLREITKHQKNVQVIRNGFDAADFEGLQRIPPDKWTLTFIGTFYSIYDPSPLFAVWRRLLDQKQMAPTKVRFQMVGQSHPLLVESLKRFGLLDKAEFSGQVTHREALQYMVDASALLLILNRERSNSGIVTGKIFEYLAARRPIFGMVPPDFEAGQIIQQAKAGWAIEANNTSSIEDAMLKSYNDFLSGRDDAPCGDLTPFERRGTTAQLAKLLDELHSG